MLTDMQIPVMLGSDKATQHLLAPVQEDLVASQNYSVGDLFIFNNGLYKVTDDIDTSDTIIIGSGAGCNADVSTQTIYEETRNGLKSTSSWTDAVANAKSFIIAAVNFNWTVSGSVLKYMEPFIIPKEEIPSSGGKRSATGYYYSGTINLSATLEFSKSSCGANCYTYESGQQVSKTATIKYYYD